MGSSQSSNNRDYKNQLGYYPNFDRRPIEDQDYIIVEQKHLGKILNGEFSNLFDDEDVEHVWIYYCPLRNEEGAKIGATVLGSVAGAAGILSFVPGISEKIIFFTISTFCLWLFKKQWKSSTFYHYF